MQQYQENQPSSFLLSIQHNKFTLKDTPNNWFAIYSRMEKREGKAKANGRKGLFSDYLANIDQNRIKSAPGHKVQNKRKSEPIFKNKENQFDLPLESNLNAE